MLIRIPNKLSSFLTHRVVSILCVFLILVSILKSNTSLVNHSDDGQVEIQTLSVTGDLLAQFYADKRQFMCEGNYLYVIIDDRIYALVDKFGKEIVCKTA